MNLLIILFGLAMKTNYSPVKIDFSKYKVDKVDIFSKDTKKNSGIDERYKNKIFDIEDEELNNIKINYNKYKILNKLESDDFSIFDKLKIIETYGILESNNKFEDLLEDWNYNIE